MSRETVLTLANLHQRDLLEEHLREELARRIAPPRQPVRLVLASWLHALATRMEGQAVVFNVERA